MILKENNYINKSIFMSLPILPLEIWDYIYLIHHNNSAQVIINYWYKYIKTKTDLIHLILNSNFYTFINNIPHRRFIINPDNISMLIRMHHTLSGNENYTWWTNVINDFIISINNYKKFYHIPTPTPLIIYNTHSGDIRNSYNIIIAEKYCNKLLHKFTYN
jgi:hypothetical protein